MAHKLRACLAKRHTGNVMMLGLRKTIGITVDMRVS